MSVSIVAGKLPVNEIQIGYLQVLSLWIVIYLFKKYIAWDFFYIKKFWRLF